MWPALAHAHAPPIATAVIPVARGPFPELGHEHMPRTTAHSVDCMVLGRQEAEDITPLKRLDCRVTRAPGGSAPPLIERSARANRIPVRPGGRAHLTALKLACVAQHDVHCEEGARIVVGVALLPPTSRVLVVFHHSAVHTVADRLAKVCQDSPVLRVHAREVRADARKDGFERPWQASVLEVEKQRPR